MTTWNYRVMRQKTPDGWWYGVFTMYYDPMGHSRAEAAVVGETLAELRDCLKKFECALEEPVLEWREGEGYREVTE